MKAHAQKQKSFKNQKGFALLMAVILTSTLLLITYSLSSITLKEITLSYAGKDSELAFYAADTGVECAQYWDIRNDGADQSAFSTITPNNQITCNNNIIKGDRGDTAGANSIVDIVPQTSPVTRAYFGKTSDGTSLFQFCINGDCAGSTNGVTNISGPCAIVTVTKKDAIANGTNEPYVVTTIESRGYNTCNTDSSQRFERALYVSY